jgi:hypothetical protein
LISILGRRFVKPEEGEGEGKELDQEIERKYHKQGKQTSR